MTPPAQNTFGMHRAQDTEGPKEDVNYKASSFFKALSSPHTHTQQQKSSHNLISNNNFIYLRLSEHIARFSNELEKLTDHFVIMFQRELTRR